MSEQKLDLILAELQKVNDRVTMIDDHATTMNDCMTIIYNFTTYMEKIFNS
ncbi:hypothetical protein R6U77_14220 [Lysinibacillus louembei]|uniref:Uncharacterized protein n=1 Tax=Lysinibacillus louembei TaxID=1470088 RepID=A0ABZ0RU54_9BACI|nr:hypothetical protein [Lysinibacillus louembei]WPK11035.1 hypothetical protein R6U77_14220 [Lysinibacillus louembei]